MAEDVIAKTLNEMMNEIVVLKDEVSHLRFIVQALKLYIGNLEDVKEKHKELVETITKCLKVVKYGDNGWTFEYVKPEGGTAHSMYVFENDVGTPLYNLIQAVRELQGEI